MPVLHYAEDDPMFMGNEAQGPAGYIPPIAGDWSLGEYPLSSRGASDHNCGPLSQPAGSGYKWATVPTITAHTYLAGHGSTTSIVGTWAKPSALSERFPDMLTPFASNALFDSTAGASSSNPGELVRIGSLDGFMGSTVWLGGDTPTATCPAGPGTCEIQFETDLLP